MDCPAHVLMTAAPWLGARQPCHAMSGGASTLPRHGWGRSGLDAPCQVTQEQQATYPAHNSIINCNNLISSTSITLLSRNHSFVYHLSILVYFLVAAFYSKLEKKLWFVKIKNKQFCLTGSWKCITPSGKFVSLNEIGINWNTGVYGRSNTPIEHSQNNTDIYE